MVSASMRPPRLELRLVCHRRDPQSGSCQMLITLKINKENVIIIKTSFDMKQKVTTEKIKHHMSNSKYYPDSIYTLHYITTTCNKCYDFCILCTWFRLKYLHYTIVKKYLVFVLTSYMVFLYFEFEPGFVYHYYM